MGYRGRAVARVPDLSLVRSEAALLLGASGSGKSTALFTIGGLLAPLAGSVAFPDPPATGKTGKAGRGVGIVFQDIHLLSGLSVLDNVLLAAFAVGARQDRARAADLLSRLGLAGVARRPAETLSRGEAQRVALARAMLLKPAVILADEPSASLDDESAEAVAELLIGAAEETGAALLIATHDARLKARIGRSVTVEAVTEAAA